jgi:hypothetical protein
MDDNEPYYVLSFDDALQLARLMNELDRLFARSEAVERAEKAGAVEVWVDFSPTKGVPRARRVYTTHAAYDVLAASGLDLEPIAEVKRKELPPTLWRLAGR